MTRLYLLTALLALGLAAAFVPEARTEEPDPAAMLLPPGYDVVDTAIFLDAAVGPPVEVPDTGGEGEPVVPAATVGPSDP